MSYDSRAMIDTYAEIYRDYYALEPDRVDFSLKQVFGNLSEIGFSEPFPRLSVLNTGPAREAFALLRFCANPLFHVDVSPHAVKAVDNCIQLFPGLDIRARVGDLCNSDDLEFIPSESIDLVYLSGVFHHLHDPAGFLRAVMPKLRIGSVVFLRVYRSGSFAFLVVDFIRRLVPFVSRSLLEARANVLFDGSRLQEDYIDDFFVPTLFLFDPNALTELFSMHGFKGIEIERYIKDFDHEVSTHSSQGCSLAFRLERRAAFNDKAAERLLRNVDQLVDIRYPDFIVENVRLMQEILKLSHQTALVGLSEFLLGLYKHSQLITREEKLSAAENHVILREMMLSFLKVNHVGLL